MSPSPLSVITWICVIVFGVTAVITLLALIGKIQLGGSPAAHDWFLKKLFGALIIEIVIICVAAVGTHFRQPPAAATGESPSVACVPILLNAKDYISSKNICTGCLPYGHEVVSSRGSAELDNKAEYLLDSPGLCTYRLHATFATAESRAVEISVDDKLVMTGAFGEITDGFSLENQREQTASNPIKLSPGLHRLSIYRSGKFPHFLRFRLNPIK